MSDRQNCAIEEFSLYGRLNDRFGLWIDCRGRLIQYEYLEKLEKLEKVSSRSKQ